MPVRASMMLPHTLNVFGAICGVSVALIALPTTVYGHLSPSARLLSPRNQSVYPVGADIPLGVTATASEGTVVLVEFLANDVKIADATYISNSIYRATWSNAPEGNFAIEARVTDSFGAVGHSDRSHIVVTSSYTNQL